MSKPKLQIIVLFQNLGESEAYFARSPAPPLAGALVAGLTPDIVDVELRHEMVRPIDYDTDAEFIALSFMDYCAPHAYEVAAKFRKRGKTVVAGGKYPSTYPADVLPHVDAVVVGEAEKVWCLHDDRFLDLLVEARCGLAFIGLESLNEPSLAAVHKKQNKVDEYRELFLKLKDRGILTFTGMMLALDEDTPEYYRELPRKLDEIDPSSILLSISIPIPGTPFHRKVASEGRITDTDLSHYEGDHLVFEPKSVAAEDVFTAFRGLNAHFYSWPSILKRWFRFVGRQNRGRGLFRRIFRGALLSTVFLRLSVFQRDHARRRVYPMAGGGDKKAAVRTV